MNFEKRKIRKSENQKIRKSVLQERLAVTFFFATT